ncbi:hypothetical protein ACJX0J_008400 [Zea mays]
MNIYIWITASIWYSPNKMEQIKSLAIILSTPLENSTNIQILGNTTLFFPIYTTIQEIRLLQNSSFALDCLPYAEADIGVFKGELSKTTLGATLNNLHYSSNYALQVVVLYID